MYLRSRGQLPLKSLCWGSRAERWGRVCIWVSWGSRTCLSFRPGISKSHLLCLQARCHLRPTQFLRCQLTGHPTPPIKATRVTFVGKCTGCKSNRRLSHCSGHPGSRHWNWGHSWQLGRPDRDYSGFFPPVFKLHYGTYDTTSLIMTLLVHWFLTLFVFFKRKSYPF